MILRVCTSGFPGERRICALPGSEVDLHARTQGPAQPWWTYSASTESQTMCAAVQSLVQKARFADNGDILTQRMLSAQPEHIPKTKPLRLEDSKQLDKAGGSMQPL